MTWLGLIARNLWRRPARSFFTLSGVALAIGGFITLSGLSGGLTEGARSGLAERRIDLIVNRRGMIEIFSGSLPDDLGPRIAEIPGVEATAAELVTFLEIDEGARAVVGGWDPAGFEMRELPLTAGRLPVSGRREVVLGPGLAEGLKVAVGSDVTLNFETFKVVGLTGFSSGVMRGLAIMPMADMQALLARPGQVTLYQVRLKDPGELATVRTRIAKLSPQLDPQPGETALSASQTIAMLQAASLAIALVALVMASLSVMNTLAMSVEERTREIGVLSMIGWRRERILTLILSEGLLLSAIGGLIGIGLGHLGSHAVSLAVLPGSGLSITSSLALDARSEAAALLVGAIGSLWPAWRAANLPPAAALQHP